MFNIFCDICMHMIIIMRNKNENNIVSYIKTSNISKKIIIKILSENDLFKTLIIKKQNNALIIF